MKILTLGAVKVRDISGMVFPIAVRSLRAAFDKTLGKAKIEDFHFHDLRQYLCDQACSERGGPV